MRHRQDTPLPTIPAVSQYGDEDSVTMATTEPCSDSDSDSESKTSEEGKASIDAPQTEAELLQTTADTLTPSIIAKLRVNLKRVCTCTEFVHVQILYRGPRNINLK